MHTQQHWSLLLLAASATAGPGFAQAPWNFANETPTRVVADPALVNIHNLPTFTDPETGLFDNSECDVIEGDFDHDGFLDIFVVRKDYNYTTDGRSDFILMNEGGKLVDRTLKFMPDLLRLDLPSRDVMTLDANSDGYLDVVIAITGGNDPVLMLNNGKDPVTQQWLGMKVAKKWFTSNGVHTFETAAFPGLGTCAVDTADIDNDGDVDIYLGNYRASTPAGVPFDGFDRILINDGTGHFVDTPSFLPFGWASSPSSGFPGWFTTGVEFGDMNGDCFVDLVRTTVSGNGVRILYNSGNPNAPFSHSQVVPVPMNFYMHALVSLTPDENPDRPDIYVGSDQVDGVALNFEPSGSGNGCMGAPNGNTTLVGSYPAPGSTGGLSGNIHSFDIDGDGHQDVGVCDQDGQSIGPCTGSGFLLLRNEYTVPFLPALVDPFEGEPLIPGVDDWRRGNVSDFAMIDLNQDSLLDLITFGCRGVEVYIQY